MYYVAIRGYMFDTFLIVLNPMLSLVFCMALGFLLRKKNILPEDAGTVMSKLINWVFFPALGFSALARYCKIDTIAAHSQNLILSLLIICLALLVATLLSKVFIKTPSAERGIYAYALMFGNFGSVGDPLVIGVFGEMFYSYYKLFTLPLTILVYTWGMSMLVPTNKDKTSSDAADAKKTKVISSLKKLFNPTTIAMLLGIIVGLTDTAQYFPDFIHTSLDSLKNCVGPVAMIVAGFTVASYDLKEMLANKKYYFATALRLFIIPTLLIGTMFFLKEGMNLLFNLSIGNSVLYLALFAYAAPLGLNTVVFPLAYGGNPKIGAGMALISHVLCAISIPIMFTLMTLVFGAPVI